MKTLFTKSFFKFLFGFSTIVALGVLGVVLIGSYGFEGENQAHIDAQLEGRP